MCGSDCGGAPLHVIVGAPSLKRAVHDVALASPVVVMRTGTGDAPIAGLWAAGSTGQGGLLLKGHGHHLAWAFVSGRRAGRFAAKG